MEGRKCVVYEYQKVEGQTYFDKFPVGNGVFLQFGIDFEELEGGPATFTTAIIEMPDGSMKNVPVELVVFNN